MTRRSEADKKAQASGNWTRAVKRKGSTKKVRPLTRRLLHISNGKATRQLFTGGRNRSRTRTAPQLSRIMEKRKTKELWLREEIRENRKMMLGLLKWGVAVLAGIESSLYFVRRDVATHLAAIGTLPAYGIVPPGRWFVGTAWMIMIAFIFSHMTEQVIRRHIEHRKQLFEMKPSYSGIEEETGSAKIRYLHYWLFYAFPAFDLLLWCYFRFTGSITITW